MKNLKEIKTTVIGAILFAVGIAFFAVNFKTLDAVKVSDIYIPGGLAVAGILFLLAPDKVVENLFNWINKNPKP